VPKILEVLCRTTGLELSAVSRVTEDRWIACAVRDESALGLKPGDELDVKATLCDKIRTSREVVVIENVAEDETYCTLPKAMTYGFQSYISVPVQWPNGDFFGTLCALGRAPARLNTPETIGMFTLFADLIGFHLAARDCLAASELALSDERRRANLRDQFIAVLGHDLRNPLGAIQTGAMLLETMPLDDEAAGVALVIQSSAARMEGLIDNVLDFARGQLGDGIPVHREVVADIEATLEQVISELRTSWPNPAIVTEFALRQPLSCDRVRIAQLFSNLLANALTHGDPAGPVRVYAQSDERGFELAVANVGEPIPMETLERLFQPFSRSSERASRQRQGQGLGLGLYIASEVTRAHGGTLDVTSSRDETRFTFRMPPAESTNATPRTG